MLLPECPCRSGNRNLQLGKKHLGLGNGLRATYNIVRTQHAICPGVQTNEVVAGRGLHHDETHAGGRLRHARAVGCINTFLLIKLKRGITESVRADPRHQLDVGSQPRAARFLIGTLAAVLKPVAGSQLRLTGRGQARDIHRQSSGVTPDHGNSRKRWRSFPLRLKIQFHFAKPQAAIDKLVPARSFPRILQSSVNIRARIFIIVYQ